MSLFRKVKLVEEGIEEPNKESTDHKINENLILIIENIIEKYMKRGIRPKPKSKLKKVKVKDKIDKKVEKAVSWAFPE